MKLERADVEWLLATHEHGRGPVNWSDEAERGREGLDVRGADLCQVDLHALPLTRLCGHLTFNEGLRVTEERSTIPIVHVVIAKPIGAKLERADFMRDNPNIIRVDNISSAKLEGANLRNVILADKRRIGPRLADVQWGGTNLAVVDWLQVTILGDEYEARQKKPLWKKGKKKYRDAWKYRASFLDVFRTAVRANRQLAVALQTQGLNEEAARFAYRAQRLQRVVLRR